MKRDTDYGDIIVLDVIYDCTGGTGMYQGETTEGRGADEWIGHEYDGV